MDDKSVSKAKSKVLTVMVKEGVKKKPIFTAFMILYILGYIPIIVLFIINAADNSDLLEPIHMISRLTFEEVSHLHSYIDGEELSLLAEYI